MKNNKDIRDLARTSNIKLWEVAWALELHPSNFSRLLSKELSPDKRDFILEIIQEIAERRKGDLP